MNLSSSAEMEYIDVRGTSQESIAKEVEEISKRSGKQIDFRVMHFNILIIVDVFSKIIWF